MSLGVRDGEESEQVAAEADDGDEDAPDAGPDAEGRVDGEAVFGPGVLVALHAPVAVVDDLLAAAHLGEST